MIITKTINTDLWIRERTQEIYAVQGDSCTRKVAVNLFAGREPWTPEGNVSAVIRFAKPDGTGGSYDTLPNGEKAWALEENTVSFILAPQMLTVPGRVVVQIELLGGSGVIASFPLHILVEENVAAGVTRSENYFSWEQRLAWERNQALLEAKQSGLFDGPAGPTPNLQIGTVTTLEPDGQAQAVFRGAAEAPVLDLALPRGKDAVLDATLCISGQAADAAAVGAALAGKAPSGFGSNGEVIAHKGTVTGEAALYDILDIELNTMPNASRKTVAASLSFSGLGGGYYIIDLYKPFAGYAYAEASTYDRKWLAFTCKNSQWQPMEWVNPPLTAGEEYRTTERFNGRVVFAKCVDLSNKLPVAGASAFISHGITMECPVECYGVYADGQAFVPNANFSDMMITNETVYVASKSTAGNPEQNNLRIVIKYLKSGI